ncbi:MAG: glycosyltransferase, partial [Candidatus Altiarchaeota archaeon]|nr:glycosyltransferase [Candidatus Altiarchaeota archaeon]
IDESWLAMKKLRWKDKRVRIIQLLKNYGQFNAIICGFNHVMGDFVITMDDDLQHPPGKYRN